MKGGPGMQPLNVETVRVKHTSSGKRISVSGILVYICLTLWSLTTIYPLFWVVNNSFKVSRDVMNNSFGLASNPIMSNYENAFDRINMGKSYMNSLIMSVSGVLLVLVFGGLAAYVIARFRFRGRNVIYSLLVATLLIPTFATIVPVYELLIKWKLVNTYLGLILPQTAGNLAFAILVISGFMATIPKDLEEAAFIVVF
jgi:raffinose/stachyose/melibiose transport system permease protein